MKPAKLLTVLLLILSFGLNFTSDSAAAMSGALFSDTAESSETPIIAVTDLNLGGYQTEMHIRAAQLLTVTVYPVDATERTVIYRSGNTNVATINLTGRITAVGAGEAVISISAGGITRAFALHVTGEPSPPHVSVSGIEISNFKDMINVDETVNLTAAVFPADASDTDVAYMSSNAGVASITPSGQIKGISSGTATITAEAGGFKKNMTLTVKPAAKSIQLNAAYLVLKPSDTYQLRAEVLPKNADQSVTYRSTSSSVISVSASGVVKALRRGSGSIIVSAQDTSSVVSIIVTEPSTDPETEAGSDPPQDNGEDIQELPPPNDSLPTGLETKIAGLHVNGELTVEGSSCRTVTSSMLKELYGTAKKLIVEYPDYRMIIYGSDIKNITNELDTSLSLLKTNRGLEFTVNDGRKMMGTIQIQLLVQESYSHLYLFNETRGEYKEINVLEDGNRFDTDAGGRYILTEKRMSTNSVSLKAILTGFGVVCIGSGAVYIAVKKKHWFW